MHIVNFEQNGERIYTAFPTSVKDLKVLFLMNGIHAWPVKWGNRYDILYPGPEPKFVDSKARTLQDFTLKQWLEIAQKNCPDQNKAEPYSTELQRWFHWPAINKHLQKSTI